MEKSTHIMLVDDNPDITRMVKKRLEKMEESFDVIVANSGQECFDILEKGEKPALFLLDIMMPNIDGWDVAAELKKNPELKNIPIVFFTAKTDPTCKAFGKILSADYIEKPIKIEELKKKIDTILKNK
jgi:CheY-like chemotaxis protein